MAEPIPERQLSELEQAIARDKVALLLLFAPARPPRTRPTLKDVFGLRPGGLLERLARLLGYGFAAV